jgi:hypothetical protein
VGVGLAVAVAVAVAVGVGEGVTLQAFGPRIPTVTGAPVLKKPMVACVNKGARSESNRKLYNVPQRIALAFWFCAKASVLHIKALVV